MSIVNLNISLAQKRANELKRFLSELDTICDMLYSRLDYKGIWDVIEKLEDVRIKYYMEFYDKTETIRKK